MTIESSFMFLISLILFWIKPGPGQITVVAKTLSDGFIAGYALAGGIMVGNSIYFVFSAVSLSVIAAHTEVISIVFKFVGAFFLIYLGYRGLRNIESGQWKSKSPQSKTKSIMKNFSLGLVITLSNPFVIFFYVGLLPHLVPLRTLQASDIAIGVLIILYFGMLVDAIICGLANQIRMTLSDKGMVIIINRITSIGFILIGGFLLFSALLRPDFSFQL